MPTASPVRIVTEAEPEGWAPQRPSAAGSSAYTGSDLAGSDSAGDATAAAGVTDLLAVIGDW